MGSGDSVSTEAFGLRGLTITAGEWWPVPRPTVILRIGAVCWKRWRRRWFAVCQHGFTARELELAKRELIAAAEMKVETESARNAKSVLLSVSEATKNGEVVMSAEQELSLVRRTASKGGSG